MEKTAKDLKFLIGVKRVQKLNFQKVISNREIKQKYWFYHTLNAQFVDVRQDLY